MFPKKEVADNPFKESFFGMDTVYVTGRITQSKYDRWGNIRHEDHSYTEQALLRQFRLGGVFDRFYVAKDGTFSFKTIVVKPTMDELFIPGGCIPILLIPDDHLQALAIARHNANKSDLYTCPIASFHSFIFSSCRL